MNRRVEDGRGSVKPRFPSPLIKPDMRSYRIRLSDWLHLKEHGEQHISTVLITITDGCLAGASYAIAPSPYGRAFSGKSEALWCLQAHGQSPLLVSFKSMPEARVLPSSGITRNHR